MKTRNVTDLIHFQEDGARTEILHETERIWSQVVCLQGAQGLGPMSDPHSDAVLLVLAGEVAVQIAKSRVRMRQWESAAVPAGDDMTLRNASEDPAVVLLVLAPPPTT